MALTLVPIHNATLKIIFPFSSHSLHGSVRNMRQCQEGQGVRPAGELRHLLGLLPGRPPTDPKALPDPPGSGPQSQMAAGKSTLNT